MARITDDPAAAQFEDAAGRLGFAARLLADDRGLLPQARRRRRRIDAGRSTGRAVDDIRDSLAVAAVLTNQPDLRIGPPPEEACWLLAHPALADAAADAPAAQRPSRSARPPWPRPDTTSRDRPPAITSSSTPGRTAIRTPATRTPTRCRSRSTFAACRCSSIPAPAATPSNPMLAIACARRALHNTLTLDGRPQSTPAGPFHWRHAATGVARRWRTNAGFDYFEGSHDGYDRFEHRRHLLVLHGDLLVVADLIAAVPGDAAPHRADVHWHVDPRWATTVSGPARHVPGDGRAGRNGRPARRRGAVRRRRARVWAGTRRSTAGSNRPRRFASATPAARRSGW